MKFFNLKGDDGVWYSPYIQTISSTEMDLVNCFRYYQKAGTYIQKVVTALRRRPAGLARRVAAAS